MFTKYIKYGQWAPFKVENGKCKVIPVTGRRDP
jgi:hypothetical protein